jgi:microcompartment protein CcmL/EutN
MTLPALALLEFDSVAAGIQAADVMVKRAPIALLKAGTVHPGHYLVLVGGTVASVEEAWRAGKGEGQGHGQGQGQGRGHAQGWGQGNGQWRGQGHCEWLPPGHGKVEVQGYVQGPGFLLDDVFLPDVHEDVLRGAMGERREIQDEALGILETRGVASLLRAADAGAKGADVRIAELRLADDLGGRAFVLFDGRLTAVQAALEIGGARITEGQVLHQSLLSRLDGNLRRLLDTTTRFSACAGFEPDGAEYP